MLVKLGRFLTVTAVVCTIFTSISCGPSPESVITKLEIIEPLDGDTIPRKATFRGVSPELPDGSTIWLFYFHTNKFIVLTQATSFRMAQESGLRWQAFSFVGDEDEIGVKYRILAAVADEKATEELISRVENGYPLTVYDEIPEGVTVHAEIIVIRE